MDSLLCSLLKTAGAASHAQEASIHVSKVALHIYSTPCRYCMASFRTMQTSWLCMDAGNYTKELEEDYYVYAAISQLQSVILANEAQCEAFKAQFGKFDHLWKKDLAASLQVGRRLKHCLHQSLTG